ncbi:MAG: hypothetical protein CMJ83_10275 [Planctomycetes bacterium]|nr:hypothetical protein [Planctomycetota bacterium]
MKRLLILTLAPLLLVGCAPEPRPQTARRGNGEGGYNSGSGTQKPKGPKYNYTQMMSKARNVESRKTKILELMDEAVTKYTQYKRDAKAGTPNKALLKAAQNLKIRAGTIYDELYEDVISCAPNEDVGDRLWNMRLRTFQTTYDRQSKKVRRIEFISTK